MVFGWRSPLGLGFLVCLPEVRVSDGRCQTHGRGFYARVYPRQVSGLHHRTQATRSPVTAARVGTSPFRHRAEVGLAEHLRFLLTGRYDRLVGFTSGRRDMGCGLRLASLTYDRFIMGKGGTEAEWAGVIFFGIVRIRIHRIEGFTGLGARRAGVTRAPLTSTPRLHLRFLASLCRPLLPRP